MVGVESWGSCSRVSSTSGKFELSHPTAGSAGSPGLALQAGTYQTGRPTLLLPSMEVGLSRYMSRGAKVRRGNIHVLTPSVRPLWKPLPQKAEHGTH